LYILAIAAGLRKYLIISAATGGDFCLAKSDQKRLLRLCRPLRGFPAMLVYILSGRTRKP